MSENPSRPIKPEFPQTGRGGWGWFPDKDTVVLEGVHGAKGVIDLSSAGIPDPPEPNGNGEEPEPSGLKPVDVTWELQSGEDPIVGNGSLYAEYAIDANNIVDLFIALNIGPSTNLGNPSGDGTSRYVFKLPEFLAPKNPSLFGSSCQAWIAGGGQKEFNGDPFFYSQITDSIAVTLGGVAWNINQPKNLNLGGGTHLSFHLRYALR